MIPQSMIDECMEKAKGSTFYGHPVLEMTREESVTAVVLGWESEKLA